MQCLLSVRDDFWMSMTRFMHALEVPLVQNENSAAVDLFNTRHAQKVLTAFGRAFEALPPYPQELGDEHGQFLSQAVADLAEDGKVVPVQLSLFAEMVKDRPWTPAILKEVGGASGVGRRFLESTFDETTSPPNTGSTSRRPKRSCAPCSRSRARHEGAHALAAGAARCLGLRRPPPRFRSADPDPGRGAAAVDADRPPRPGARGGPALPLDRSLPVDPRLSRPGPAAVARREGPQNAARAGRGSAWRTAPRSGTTSTSGNNSPTSPSG